MKPSRAMITGEIALAFVAFCIAWSAAGVWPFEASALHELMSRGTADGLLLGPIMAAAIALIWVDVRAWRTGPTNPIEAESLASMRSALCVWLTFGWFYMFYLLTATSRFHPTAEILIAPGAVVMNVWFWIENRRVRRECRKQTVAYHLHHPA